MDLAATVLRSSRTPAGLKQTPRWTNASVIVAAAGGGTARRADSLLVSELPYGIPYSSLLFLIVTICGTFCRQRGAVCGNGRSGFLEKCPDYSLKNETVRITTSRANKRRYPCSTN